METTEKQQIQRGRNQSIDRQETKESKEASRDRDNSAILRKYHEELENSYSALAKRKFSNRGEYLFAKAMISKETK